MRPLRKLVVLALASVAFAVPALAQSPAPYGPACEASKVSKGDVERAHTVFLSGRGFLDEANYDKAISYFKDAYSIDCSVHAILPIIATAYERKGDKAAAVVALQEYLKRVASAPDREVMERRIRNLQDQLSHEPVAPPPSASASSPPPPVEPPPAPTAITPPLPPPPPPVVERGHTAGPWVVVGIGGAALAAGVVVYAVGAGDVSSAQNACPSRDNCTQAVADQGNNGRKNEGAGAVVGSIGAAALVGGLIWHFAEPTGPQPATGTRVTPVVAPGYGGLALGGSF